MIRRLLIWGVLALALVVGAAALFTSKTFRVEKTIAAPPELVWQVLTDTRAYPDWNPVFVEVEGTYAQGADVLNRVRDADGNILEMTARVDEMTPNRVLRQSGGMAGILTFDHRWLLEPVAGGTRAVQLETDRGIGLWFWNSDWIEPAYSATNDALAARVEAVMKARKQ